MGGRREGHLRRGVAARRPYRCRTPKPCSARTSDRTSRIGAGIAFDARRNTVRRAARSGSWCQFPDALNPQRGEVDGHPVLEARAEKSVNVRVRGSVYTAVLVDGKDTLHAAGGAAKRLLHGITQDAVAERAIQPAEAVGGGVVHGQDEAEVDGVPEPARVLAESLPDCSLVALHDPVAVADSVELAPASVGQSLLAVGDVAHLSADATGVPVVARLDEEHVRLPRCSVRSWRRRGLAPRQKRFAPIRPR